MAMANLDAEMQGRAVTPRTTVPPILFPSLRFSCLFGLLKDIYLVPVLNAATKDYKLSRISISLITQNSKIIASHR